LKPLTDPLTQAVVAVFRTPGVALWLAAAILLAAFAIIAASAAGGYRSLLRDLQTRLDLIGSFSGPSLQRSFHDRLAEIDGRFATWASEPELASGWRHWRSQLMETEGGVCGSFIPAAESFPKLDEPARALEWWANILVALGLVVTFLGIVAALSEATASIGTEGATGAAAQASLLGLLAIASTKFWTSIAGVLASIILRVVARGRRQRITRLEEQLFAELDACVELLSPQRLMVDQLAALARIEARLSTPAGAAA
jgi:hypothetical protein